MSRKLKLKGYARQKGVLKIVKRASHDFSMIKKVYSDAIQQKQKEKERGEGRNKEIIK